MIALLTTIADTLVALGQSVLWALLTSWNLLMAAIGAALTAALALLPSMSDAPAIGTPQWLHWANWFFPIGDFLSVLTGGITMFVAFLAVRYVLRVVRAI